MLDPHHHPYAGLVPKEYTANLRFRRRVLELAYQDEEYAKELWIACKRDYLFYFNVFGWTYNPRLMPKSTVVPFITYAYQDKGFEEMFMAAIMGYDLYVEKSRDMGVTWMFLWVDDYLWRFHSDQSIRLVSRNENLVDKTEDPDSLFWKLDFINDHLPYFLRLEDDVDQHRTHLQLKNHKTGSMINGVSTTGDVSRGGRCGLMDLDEFAAVDEGEAVLKSTRDVTNCRFFVSTHKGTNTAFYRLGKTNIRKLRMHWSEHPEKRKGLYQADAKGVIRLLDDFKGTVRDNTGQMYRFPEDYPFRKDGKLRSPWYDVQCDRASHPMEIAQELDIDPFSSDFQFFDSKKIDEIESRDVRFPTDAGELIYDTDLRCPSFRPSKEGKLLLWVDLVDGKPPSDTEYVMGVDIAAGTGASNSAIAVYDKSTRTKVAEFASPFIKPEAFARYAVALAWFFGESYMIWDGGGHGRVFGDSVIEEGYRNIYYKRNEQSLDKKLSLIPGCFLNPKEKLAVLGGYRKALQDGTIIQRSHDANAECLQYVFTTSNTVEHSSCRNTIDPSGARDNHGDRVVADALANKGMDTSGTPIEEDVQDDKYTRTDTFYHRQQQAQQKNEDDHDQEAA